MKTKLQKRIAILKSKKARALKVERAARKRFKKAERAEARATRKVNIAYFKLLDLENATIALADKIHDLKERV